MSVRQAGYLLGKWDDEKRAANIPYYARVYLHGNGSTKGLYAGACSLDREKLTRESRGSKEVHARRNRANLLTRCWLDLSDSIFAFFLLYPMTVIVPDSKIARKVSYIQVVIKPAFFLQQRWRILRYRDR